jgi:hypothetical protein
VNKKGKKYFVDKVKPDGLLVPDGSATPDDSDLPSILGENKTYRHICKIQKVLEIAKNKKRKKRLSSNGVEWSRLFRHK